MKIAIMQPYFMPYVGYFQLMDVVDEFIVYDNVKYTKKGWFNRNRILINGSDAQITLPLRKDSDFLQVKERYLADTWANERKTILNRIRGAYGKAPHFEETYGLVERIMGCDDRNLFGFLHNSLQLTKDHLGIATPLVVSSSIPMNHELKAEDRVITTCKARCAQSYINPIGGLELYCKERFEKEGISLNFIRMDSISYQQFGREFVSSLSIIDVMMFNARKNIREMLEDKFTLV